MYVRLAPLCLALALVLPAESDAQQAYAPLVRKPAAEALAGLSLDVLDNGAWAFRFEPDGRASFSGAMATTGEGQWTADGEHGLHAKGTASGGPCMDEEEDCDASWPWEERWSDLWVSPGQLVVFRRQGGERYVMRCEDTACYPGPDLLVQVMPGNEDRALFDSALPAISAQDATVISGPAARNPRETSEIWYVKGSDQGQDAAQQLAGLLGAVLGPIQPQEWTWGGPYDVIVVVGATKAVAAE